MSKSRSDTESNFEGKISRRDFLKYMGAAGAIVGLSSVPFAKTFSTGTNATNNNPPPTLPSSSKSKQILSSSQACHSITHCAPKLIQVRVSL
jgi:TAT (twin-arginine translocation) pathway signal sequence